MKKIRLIRLICVIVLAVILIVASLFILIPRRNDSSSGRAALCFVHEDIMFPQMDYSQLFSQLDIASYYVIDDSCSKEEMQKKISKISAPNGLILFCEGDYALSGLQIASENAGITDLFLVSPELSSDADLGRIGTTSPSCRVAIFSEAGKTADNLYERLSGEDTKFTPGTRTESGAPELYLSSDANRYYAKNGKTRTDEEIAADAKALEEKAKQLAPEGMSPLDFYKLVKTNTNDQDEMMSGGYTSGDTKAEMLKAEDGKEVDAQTQALAEWLFAAERKQGDIKIVVSSDNKEVTIYYFERSAPAWMANYRENQTTANINKLKESLKSTNPQYVINSDLVKKFIYGTNG